jgi:hypothetical protein
MSRNQHGAYKLDRSPYLVNDETMKRHSYWKQHFEKDAKSHGVRFVGGEYKAPSANGICLQNLCEVMKSGPRGLTYDSLLMGLIRDTSMSFIIISCFQLGTIAITNIRKRVS